MDKSYLFKSFLTKISDPVLTESILNGYNTLFESFEVEGFKAKIKTDIKPENRELSNIPKYANGKNKVHFEKWLELTDVQKYNGTTPYAGKAANGKWYGWSHRAVYGFGIGDKVKKGDCAYKGKSYTIKTETQAKETAIAFADSVS